MDTAETVVEEIRTDAAIDAARTVADDAAGATLVVAAEVAAVGSELAEHAEASEERHEEILGDTEWLKTQLAQLSMSLQTILTTVAAMQAATTAEFLALRTMIESTVTPRSPQLPPESEVIPVVEPVAVEDHAAAETPTPAVQPARRVRRAI